VEFRRSVCLSNRSSCLSATKTRKTRMSASLAAGLSIPYRRVALKHCRPPTKAFSFTVALLVLAADFVINSLSLSFSSSAGYGDSFKLLRIVERRLCVCTLAQLLSLSPSPCSFSHITAVTRYCRTVSDMDVVGMAKQNKTGQINVPDWKL